ncbi:hypothetical protein BDZ97DRAFT_1817842 [Flammula alnicola]|nr:hypothetical protein BDZ97DRAFT_1817842 [Flammula alnicola]
MLKLVLAFCGWCNLVVEIGSEPLRAIRGGKDNRLELSLDPNIKLTSAFMDSLARGPRREPIELFERKDGRVDIRLGRAASEDDMSSTIVLEGSSE